MDSKVIYTLATSQDLHEILELQKKNHKSALDEDVKKMEGFVTVVHSIELLQKLNQPHPHVIAKVNGKVVAYALVMVPEMKNEIEILKPMFEQVELEIGLDKSFIVMGQICIAKEYRGKGIFYGLYNKMKTGLDQHFDLCITEVSKNNERSIRAHQKQGFTILKSYVDKYDEAWELIVWNWNE